MAQDREPQPERVPLISRLTVSQWFAWAALLLGLVTAVSVALGILAIVRLSDARELAVGRNGPALTASLEYANALVNQETGVRGYALTGEEDFLSPYRGGRRDAAVALERLRRLTDIPEHETIRADIAEIVAAAERWHEQYAAPTIRAVAADGPGSETKPQLNEGRELFDDVRAAISRQQADTIEIRNEGRTNLSDAAHALTYTFIAIALLLAVGIVGVVVALRRIVTLPLRGVARQVRRTARGDFGHEINGAGPREIVALAGDVDVMRERILEELSAIKEANAALDEQTRELQRSNAELEQFAYVASHDLQEPLRKVASFCQLIEKRYKGQLDDRGEQYIAFAVDGAKRMQQLINDLLAFSRVGRVTADREVLETREVLRHALTSLGTAIDESRAEIVVEEPLPRVRGEASLLAGVFQNLVGNALKFRDPDRPPHVELGARRVGDQWEFHVTDNGIGIEPDYAERIFMIFQRLHPKDVYAGTGIGLAMCRKIIEYHGGRIWLDTESRQGTTFRFTLPALQEDA